MEDNREIFAYEEDGVLTPEELELMTGMTEKEWGEYQERLMEEHLYEQKTEK